MKSTRLLFLPLLLIAAAAGADPQTLRLDYFHGGSSETEMFSVDRVVLEPLDWPGNPARPVDRTLRGKYLFEVRPPGSDEILYSRSFSSIYGEWETTAEARERNRTFHESLRFPAPAAPVDVVLKKRDPAQAFVEVWRTRVDPADYLVHRETAPWQDRVVPIGPHGDSATRVDLLLLGDGYTEAEQEKFLQRARELTERLFATAPFGERRDDFNVWALAPPARVPGVSRPSTGIYRDSPLGVTYDAFRSERYVLTYDNPSLRRIASSAPYEFIEILANGETYGGGGIYGLYSTAAADSEWADYLFIHEFAHHFAGLADEYYTSSVAYEPPDEISEPYEPNVSALLDPERLKWRHLVARGTPLPTPWPKADFEEHSLAYQAERARMRAENVPEAAMNELFRSNQSIVESMFAGAEHRDVVGAFEGALYQAEGYYRPALNCIMFTRTAHFCPVCREALNETIDEYSRP